ncbi:hypothetical protein WR25_05308 [Diploscapter pachys]|uniref:Uncharacterized protein n=1 Tax=Diploscapter pachys TaxID=2018661 RepID=A0A2A2JC42_9BILA|nr:hypothetical protein WR25_05308 [Diploscapter pachys]
MKMMLLYLLSTLGIVICMIIIIPQFFDFNNKRGYRSHLCLVSPKVAWIKFSILAIYVLLLGMTILWVWLDCKSIVTNFFSNFNYAATGEEFVHRLENEFNCVSDDDKEGYDPSKVSPPYAESITFSEKIDFYWIFGNFAISRHGDLGSRNCYRIIKSAFAFPFWLDILFYVYIAGHTICFLAIPFFNKQLIKPDPEDIDPHAEKHLVEQEK